MSSHALPVALFALLTGCSGSGLGSVAAYDDLEEGGARIVEGSPEALGMLAFLNDPATTFDVLDSQVGLDRRAAESILAHRNGPDGTLGWQHDDLFDSVGEVDRCYYVGADALRRIQAWATDHGYVALDDDAVLGTWDDVTFTVGEARATVELANTAGPDFLDDGLGLDRRAVDSIVDARPIQSVQHLAGLYYVGRSALDTLKGAAAGEPECDKPGWDTEYVYANGEEWRSRLPSGLVAIIDETLENDAWCGDDSRAVPASPRDSSGQPWFVKATVDRFECAERGYTIELGQPMAEYPDSIWYIEFEVSEDLAWFHSTCEI
ncbi:MAG: hypothetical protein R3F61_24070 [Myxococcota bacterium]